MKVICKVNRGYNFTEGKTYDLVEFIPRLVTDHFTFPRYVVVVDDNGKTAQAHAYRFDMLDGQSCEEYMAKTFKDEKAS
mgnify:CR=1 FL=1